VDGSGNIYVADGWNNRIRRIDPSGRVTTVAGNGKQGWVDGTGGENGTAEFSDPCGVAVDGSGNLWIADSGNNSIRKIDPSGNVTTLAGIPVPGATFYFPEGLAIDGMGNTYVGDTDYQVIQELEVSGNVITLAGNGISGFADGRGGPDGGAEFAYPGGVAIDGSGNIYIADEQNNRIRKIDSAGNVTTLAGNGIAGLHDGTGGPDGEAEFNSPHGVAVDGAGILFVTDSGNNRIRQVDPSGNVTTIAGSGVGGFADGPGGLSGTAEFALPYGVALDRSGNLYIGDFLNDRIREILR
jgi:sugar lactone lactonase YvrE